MADLSALKNLAGTRIRTDEERWFPLKYSDVEAERTKQRQEACKSFIFGPIRTMDAQERVVHPIKAIPRMPYLEEWVDCLVAEDDILAPKVRRMVMTLTAEAYCVWRLCERPGCYIAMVHATEDDGRRHIEEDIKQIMWESLPKTFTANFAVAEAKGHLVITHRIDQKTGNVRVWDSWLKPYATGAKQLRSFGHGVILWDEFSTHPGAKVACKGILPTLLGRTRDRGQLIRMGTVNPDTASGRYFKELYEANNLRRARMVARYGAEIQEMDA